MKPLVLYHANCPDGFGAAWVLWKKFGAEADYRPMQYGDPPPDPQGRSVYVVDFSFPRVVIEHWLKDRVPFMLIDHHKTAAEDLADLCMPTAPVFIDQSHSGAVLTWTLLFQTEPPEFLKLIEARDLWKFSILGSREHAAALRSYPMEFAVWDDLATEEGTRKLVEEGGAILRYQSQIVQDMADRAVLRVIGGRSVPVVNATACYSEVGEELCNRNPESPFAAYWFDRADGKRQWGLRSRGGFDCSQVAKQYGGGGHPGAAGFISDQTWAGD